MCGGGPAGSSFGPFSIARAADNQHTTPLRAFEGEAPSGLPIATRQARRFARPLLSCR
jgi:hypothetical protein